MKRVAISSPAQICGLQSGTAYRDEYQLQYIGKYGVGILQNLISILPKLTPEQKVHCMQLCEPIELI